MATKNATSTAGGFTFQQPPRSVGNFQPTPQYRDPRGGSSKQGNIMHDRRVVRGNTYAAQVMSLTAQAELQRAEKENDSRKKLTQKKAAQAARSRELLEEAKRASTPDPVDGRAHMDVQTQEYLEELKDKPDEVQQETQTDPMLDRPPTPTYVPFKTGRDADTQILEGELFQFDVEVDPILDVMVGKTLEQAMLEVLQEEELEALRSQQSQFEQRRKEELLETQRLEAQERRKYDEKERRKKQEVARIHREKETREKLKSRMFAKAFLTNLEHHVFARLEDEGWFRDGVQAEVELNFFPWLMEETEKELDKCRKARAMVDMLIRESVARPATTSI
eukprot:GILI01005822.1.p1 GENE.GILI01005822.1~~GILI01005822.1.p1  ORF type:complete len:363 (-),score=111.37 GILI01005822.1:186-1190(-)